MTVQTRIEPIDRDIALMLSEELSPQGQSKVFAEFAGEQIEDAKQTNRTVLGRIPRHTIAVDGKIGAALTSVKPDGVVLVEFELLTDVLVWIGDQLTKNSPVGKAPSDKHPGLYRESHTLFADDTEVPVGAVIPDAKEYVFMNLVPYSRVIEKGSSPQNPDGVYQVLATLARRRFGNVAKVFFTYRGIVGGRQINPQTIGASSHQAKRGAGGRFVSSGGSRAHNVSEVRFPAIYVTGFA